MKAALFYAVEWRTLVIWLACSVLATYSGPFGTYQAYSSVELFSTWLLLIGVAIVTAYIIYELCSVFLPNVPPLVCNLIFFTAGSISIGVIIEFILVKLLSHDSTAKPSLLLLILYTFAVMCFVQIVRKVLLRGADYRDFVVSDRAKETPTRMLSSHSRLAKRLEIPLSSRIDRVCADGHFIEVYTPEKKYRTRMRFSDAIAELDGTCGLTVHRSHWVHCDIVKGWVPNSKRPYVVLEDGTQIPVSKTNFDKVARENLTELEEAELAS